MCGNAFYSIHGISERRVRTVLTKVNSAGMVGQDRRQKGYELKCQENKRGECRNLVTEHIHSIPAVSSHYARDKNPFSLQHKIFANTS